jgi:hypothetical protein
MMVNCLSDLGQVSFEEIRFVPMLESRAWRDKMIHATEIQIYLLFQHNQIMINAKLIPQQMRNVRPANPLNQNCCGFRKGNQAERRRLMALSTLHSNRNRGKNLATNSTT